MQTGGGCVCMRSTSNSKQTAIITHLAVDRGHTVQTTCAVVSLQFDGSHVSPTKEQ